MKVIFLFVVTMTICFNLLADVFPVPQGEYSPLCYTAYKPSGDIIIDGKLDEVTWQNAPWTEDFVDIEGDLKPIPHYRTRAKLVWDENWIYVAAEMIEPHIWAKLTERDAVIFHDNDFEMFLDPDGDTHDYYELEINAMGTLWDLFIIKPYRDRDQVAVNAWDIRGIEYSIGLDGTLNDPTDTDKAWYLEMRIPMRVLAECAHMPIPPREGDYWRMNFSRVQWETEIIDGDYIKKAGVPEYNWVWSSQGLIAMHYPERWGYLYFSHFDTDAYSNSSLFNPASSWLPPTYGIPDIEYVKEYLRQLYYKQKQYYMEHNRYASSLRQLRADKFSWKGKKLPVQVECHSQGYIITTSKSDGLPSFCIREDGLIWTPKR